MITPCGRIDAPKMGTEAALALVSTFGGWIA
jgi:hypothetical protein